jgi:protein-S-isoprenylcysteine O-methyltransferase Ste14
MIELSLLDHPGTADDAVERFLVVGRRFGFYGILSRRRLRGGADFADWMGRRLADLEGMGRIFRVGDTWQLTESGRREAEQLYEELSRTGRIINRVLAPENASLVTMIVHFVLAGVKLPAALISGSVGLLNDAVDTLMDGISSLLVFFGIRKGFEKAANIVLVTLMSITAVYTLFEAVRRVFVRSAPEVDLFTFIAVAVSAVICLFLFLYQRLAGQRGGSVALIIQSVDSRNHIIAAVSVGAGLAALYWDFIWLDIAVGLTVALIIGKSALELIAELIRTAGKEDEGPDLARYGFFASLQEKHAAMRMTFLAWEEKFASAEELKARFTGLLNTESSRALQALDLHEMKDRSIIVERSLAKAFAEGWLESDDGISVTDSGVKKLRSVKLLPGPTGDAGAHRQGVFHSTAALVSGAVVFTALFLAGNWLQDRLGMRIIWNRPSAFPGGLTAETARWISIILGGAVFALANIDYRHAFRHIRRVRRGSQRPERLEDSGPYARTRHPLYAGMILKILAAATALGSIAALAFGMAFSAIQFISTIIEDKRMESKILPEVYPEYKTRVKSLLFTPVQVLVLFLLISWCVAGLYYAG